MRSAALNHHKLVHWPSRSAEMCRGFFGGCKLWRILSGIFMEDFLGTFSPQKRGQIIGRENAQKIRQPKNRNLKQKKVPPKTDPNIQKQSTECNFEGGQPPSPSRFQPCQDLPTVTKASFALTKLRIPISLAKDYF